MSNFSQRVHASAASCWRAVRHPWQGQNISDRNALPSQTTMKQDKDDGLVNPNYTEQQIDVDGCKLQLSRYDTRYPVQTLYVDEKLGKLSSSRLSEDAVRQPNLSEIEEEGGSRSGSGLRKEIPDVDTGDTFLLCGDCKGTQRKEVACQDGQHEADPIQKSSKSPAGEGLEDKEPDVSEMFIRKMQEESGMDDKREQVSGSKREKETIASEDQEEGDHGSNSNSVSSNNSCRNQLMEILEDAFKMELAPGVSKLMAEYCDSTQGSNAAGESFDIDFQSYHGDDNEDADEEVNWIGPVDGALSCSSSEDLNNNIAAKDCKHLNLSPGEVIRSAEMEIDHLILENSRDDSSDDEAERNFIREGRHVDVQKMLSETFEMLFGDRPSRKDGEGEVNSAASKKQDFTSRNQALTGANKTDDGENESISISNNSSLYRVSAMNESAFTSDVSMEVNVTESNKSSLDSFPSWENSISGTRDMNDEEGGITLHSALTKMDLTTQEMNEVKEWFGGHGSVRNLVRDYEDKIRQLAGDNPLHPTIMSLGNLLRKEFACKKNRVTGDDETTKMTYEEVKVQSESLSDAEVADDGNVDREEIPDGADQQQSIGPEETKTLSGDGAAGKSASAPEVALTTERSYDESWLWPGSGDEDESFEEQLRRSMDSMGIVQDEVVDDQECPPASGWGDATKVAKEPNTEGEDCSPMVSPPPPTCTPEGGSSPPPSPVDQADSSISSRVNNSGDCEPPVASAQVSQDEVTKEDTPTPGSPVREPAALGQDCELSPPSEATRRLMKIDVMRSPTVEAIYISSV